MAVARKRNVLVQLLHRSKVHTVPFIVKQQQQQAVTYCMHFWKLEDIFYIFLVKLWEKVTAVPGICCFNLSSDFGFNLLAPEFYTYILAHTVCKMWITHEPKKVALWNKRHFEEKNGESAACLKYSVLTVVDKIYKMQHLEGSGTPVLYIRRTVLKG